MAREDPHDAAERIPGTLQWIASWFCEAGISVDRSPSNAEFQRLPTRPGADQLAAASVDQNLPFVRYLVAPRKAEQRKCCHPSSLAPCGPDCVSVTRHCLHSSVRNSTTTGTIATRRPPGCVALRAPMDSDSGARSSRRPRWRRPDCTDVGRIPLRSSGAPDRRGWCRAPAPAPMHRTGAAGSCQRPRAHTDAAPRLAGHNRAVPAAEERRRVTRPR